MVKDAMTLLADVYMLDVDRKTDAELLLDVHKHGFSRIPVYANEKFVTFCLSNTPLMQLFSRSNVIGIVKLRDFALITPEQYHLTVKNLLEFHSRRRLISSIRSHFECVLRYLWLC
jgi:CBS domain containing-hemolysin-like protein